MRVKSDEVICIYFLDFEMWSEDIGVIVVASQILLPREQNLQVYTSWGENKSYVWKWFLKDSLFYVDWINSFELVCFVLLCTIRVISDTLKAVKYRLELESF